MGFISFAGRVLFSSIFILAAWQRFNEFADDGGPAVKLLEPKYSLVKNHVTSSLGFQVPEIEIKHLVAAEIALKGIGGILFIFGSSFGAHLLDLFIAIFHKSPEVYITWMSPLGLGQVTELGLGLSPWPELSRTKQS
ncbi:hypothetical protein AMTR_s00012p00262190 [Amborella trichopoda]|uniref:Uncharacterized protein n=1 Tax=Amborella trichopoda TaxID=13333 RepID=W1PDM6_AMBTC|nr:hypothetical protein AMTR_s00012p00262190 [Amborella trichopoda]